MQTQFYVWEKNGPADFRVYGLKPATMDRGDCLSMHTTKRSAEAAINKLYAKEVK